MKGGRSIVFKGVLLGLALVLLVLSSFSQNRLNKLRGELGLTRLKPLQNAPPLLAFTTVALGGFRGLIADLLWIRASNLQEAGKYFEMVQLSDWITTLQPYIPTVWYFQAWNMAWNISIKFKDPAERWHWVERGYRLLRDEALKYNPHVTKLYRELAWVFQSKIGGILDDEQLYYKEQWAKKMTQAVGGPRPDYPALLHPKTPAEQAQLKELETEYKLYPKYMKEVDDNYGPLDWRMPETYAIYWAVVGLHEGSDTNRITLRRVIYQCMQLAFQRGHLIWDRTNHLFLMGPNLDIIPHVNESYIEMGKEAKQRYKQNIATAHKNFLKDAVYFLYTYNQIGRANHWFNYLKKEFPKAIPPGQTLDDYVVSNVTEVEGGTSHIRTMAVIEGLLVNSFFNMAIGQEDRALGYKNLAEKVYARFQRKTTPSAKRVHLRPFNEIQQEVLNRLLNPKQGLSAPLAARLRTNLGLPPPTHAAPSAATTNAPGAAVSPPVR